MKDQRQARILEIISRVEVQTQEELAAYLETVGCSTTQATVSRDIKELGLIKVAGKSGHSAYQQASYNGGDSLADRLVRILRNSVLSIDFTSNIIVIKTFSGGGNAAAAALDSLQIDGIMGTIAGDDTILAIVKDSEHTEAIASRLGKMLNK